MELYQRYGPALLRKAARLLGNEADAQDVVQGLFVEMLRRRDMDRDLPYLYRSVTNRCLNFLRDSGNREAPAAEAGGSAAGARSASAATRWW
jgi:RNA polymerase sigma-70 factor (ECF subfamily)